MSRENVEIVRQAWKAYDERGIDGYLDYVAEDCVCEDFPELPDRGTYIGREGQRERYWHFVGIWGEFAMDPVEFIDAGNDVVIAVVAMTGRGEGSGAPLHAPAVFVYELRDGAVVRDRPFTSKVQALEAVGLRE